jgi:bleomycin hydrolase
MKEVWNILSVALGVPPKADEKFKWEYYDEKGVVRVFEGTPVEFYKVGLFL